MQQTAVTVKTTVKSNDSINLTSWPERYIRGPCHSLSVLTFFATKYFNCSCSLAMNSVPTCIHNYIWQLTVISREIIYHQQKKIVTSILNVSFEVGVDPGLLQVDIVMGIRAGMIRELVMIRDGLWRFSWDVFVPEDVHPLIACLCVDWFSFFFFFS